MTCDSGYHLLLAPKCDCVCMSLLQLYPQDNCDLSAIATACPKRCAEISPSGLADHEFHDEAELKNQRDVSVTKYASILNRVYLLFQRLL